jgi:ribosomal protein S16
MPVRLADGRFIEILGHYDPRQDPSVLTVDNDKAVKWLSEGAQPTERVFKASRDFRSDGTVQGIKGWVS